MASAYEKKGQKNWRDLGLCDLRHHLKSGIEIIPQLMDAGNSQEEAVQILLNAFDLKNEQENTKILSCIGEINVHGRNMAHIAEKRQDARERYVNFAIQAMNDPYEIWEIVYEQPADAQHSAREFTRKAFIGFFLNTKTQILVTIDTADGDVLWNFMQQDKKSLNKHRHGVLMYSKI